MSFWTDARVLRLEDLWERGYSAGAIAQLLGTTRNAVAGKAWRLELPDREVIYRLPPHRSKPRRRLARVARRPKLPPKPRHNGDFSWHVAQVAAGVAPRGNVPDPPAGYPSWKTFLRRLGQDGALAMQVLIARQENTRKLAA